MEDTLESDYSCVNVRLVLLCTSHIQIALTDKLKNKDDNMYYKYGRKKKCIALFGGTKDYKTTFREDVSYLLLQETEFLLNLDVTKNGLESVDETTSRHLQLPNYAISKRLPFKMTNLPIPCINLSSTYLEDKFYLTGGKSKDDIAMTDTQIYNIATDSWYRGPDLSHARYWHGSIAIENLIFVVGGYNKANLLTERLDVREGKWTELPVSSFANRTLSFVITENHLLFQGFVLDNTRRNWVGLPTPFFIHGGAGCAQDGIIYVTGGFETEACCKYNWRKCELENIAYLPHSIASHNTFSHNGEIYVIGGDLSDDDVEYFFVYNPKTDEWKKQTLKQRINRYDFALSKFDLP